MGCDIHLYVEVKKKGKWVTADTWKTEYDDQTCPDVPYELSYYHDRNYNLFGILANVRNGVGFAGIEMGEGYKPISEPRGLPHDVCLEVKAQHDRWDGDGHSHSYFTVAELMAYDWTQGAINYGVVSGTEYEAWERWKKKNGYAPESYCGDTSAEKIPEAAMLKLVKTVRENSAKLPYTERKNYEDSVLGRIYTRIQWREPYYRSAGSFMSETLPRLWRLGAHEDVRIVFWFDN